MDQDEIPLSFTHPILYSQLRIGTVTLVSAAGADELTMKTDHRSATEITPLFL
jgi:hypothetical protein